MATEPQLARRPGVVGLAKAALVRGQALAGTVRGGQQRPGLRILYYHRISDERDPLAVTPAAFRRQMDALAACGQRVVDLYEIDELTLAADESAVALTFDDGYRDVLEHGLPVLREHGFPSTVFVVPGAIAGVASFSWYGAGAMPPLAGWDELRAEERAGLVHFEPHTITHPVLTTIALEHARSEIADSKRAVEQELGRPARIFCYPGGYYSPREVEPGAGVRLPRRRDLRVRRERRRPSRTTSCGGRSSSAPIRCGCSARGSPARPTRRRPAAAPRRVEHLAA